MRQMLSPLARRVKHQRRRVLIMGFARHIIGGMPGTKKVNIDARVSTAVLVAVAAAALFVVTTPGAMAVLLVYQFVLWGVVGGRSRAGEREGAGLGVGARSAGRHLVRLAPAVALIVALNGLLVPGETILSLGGKTLLTREGAASGLFFSLRLLVLYAAMVLFLAATPPAEFARGVYATLKPISGRAANRTAFYGFLVLSFIPLFSDELDRIRQAQSFRGADLKSGGIRERVGAARALVVPLLLSAVHRSGQLAAVIELRGLRDRVGSALPPGRPGAADAVVAGATAVVLAALAAWSGRGGG